MPKPFGSQNGIISQRLYQFQWDRTFVSVSRFLFLDWKDAEFDHQNQRRTIFKMRES